jgi:SP family general alpha glucoside:H+ symporter-like MFS transporter
MSAFTEDDEKKVDLQYVEDVAGPGRAIVPEHEIYSIAKTMRVFWRSTLIAVGISLAAVFECFALIVPNSIVANRGFIRDFGRVYGTDGTPIAMDPTDLSNWNLAGSLGAVLGLAVGGFLGDRFGRKVVLMVCTANLTIAVILSVTIKPSFGGWLARGLMAGTSQGLLQSSLVPYLSEIAPSKIRGMYLSLYSFFWGMGILVASIALYISEQIDPDNWKGPFYAQFVFLGLFFPALIFAPETPWFLARKGQEEKAKRSLRQLYGNIASYDVDREYLVIMAAIDAEKPMHADGTVKAQAEWRQYLDCFQGTNLRRTLVGALPIVAQAFAGVMLFYGYTVYFFEQAGYPKPFEANLIFGFCQLAGVVTSFVALDYFGRRPVLIFGTGFCAICCWALGGIAFMESPPGAVMAALACLWVFVYSTSLGPLGYNYIGEVPTQRLKSKSAAIAFTGNTASNLLFRCACCGPERPRGESLTKRSVSWCSLSSYLAPYMLSPLKWGWGLKVGE